MTASSGTAAIANADQYDTYAVGYCLKFVRGPTWEIGSLYASAIDAWNGAHKKHPGDRNPPDGAPCFYRGGTYGHIVSAKKRGSGRMKSTDCTYAGQVNDAALSWPETAWGDDYLGWTEDLNGVDLPLFPPQPTPEDPDMPKYLRAKMTKTLNLKADTWTSVEWDDVPQGGDKITEGEAAIRIGGSMVAATLTATVTADGEVIRTRFLERSLQGDEWVTNETWPNVEHLVTGGSTYLADSRNQSVADGRRLVAQLNAPAGGKVTGAEFNALTF